MCWQIEVNHFIFSTNIPIISCKLALHINPTTMKKNCFGIALLFLLFSQNTFSQFIFSEDFQQGIPNTWTLINVDGRTPDSTMTLPSQITDAWVALDDFGNPGDTFAASTSKYLPAGQANDWLITPAIVTQSSSVLTWFANAFIAAGDGYEVRISTTTPTVNGFLAHPPLLSVTTENAEWTRRNADLSGYPNQTVYLAFRNYSTDKYVLGINDVAVFDCNTFSADAGALDTSTTVSCAGFELLDLGLTPVFSSGGTTNNIDGNTNDVADWSPLSGRPFDDGGCCEGFFYNPPYQLVQFQVTASGSYTFNQTQTGYDGVVYLYTDPFDLTANPPTTFIAGNDDDINLGAGYSEITANLTQGINYYLVSTGYETGDAGNYTTTVTGAGSLILSDPNAADLPFDYNYIVTDANGVIVSIGDDLTNTTTFPGSVAGDTYSVCGISYIASNINLSSYIGLQRSVLENDIAGNSCAELTGDCHTAVVLSGGTVDAGVGDTVCAGTPVFLTASGGTTYVWSTTDTTATIEVIPLYTTIYSVTAEDNIGCLATDEVTVTVFSADGGTFKGDPVEACEGSPDLNLAPTLEFKNNFQLAGSNIISGNTVNYLTWDTLPGRPFEDGTCCSGFNVVYDVKPFQVDETGLYTFNQSQAGYDGIMYLYTDPFQLISNPPTTFIIGNDDGALTNTSSFDVQLQASTTYYLVSTGFSPLQYGDYITAVIGPGDLLLPTAPDSTDFGFEYLVVENGIITEFNKDLSNPVDYPGSVSGTEYTVCAVSYLRDSININLYLNQPFSSLSGTKCLDPSDNCQSVIIYTVPVAQAGADDTICFNTPYILNANAPAFGTGTWDVVSGNAAFTNFRDPNTQVVLAGGVNVLRWTIDNGGCAHSDSVSIFVNEPTADAGADDTICFAETTTLTAIGTGVTYAWSTGDSTASTTVTPDETTTYLLFVTDANGCTASDEATVLVNQLPLVDVPDASICVGGSTILDAGFPGSDYLWSTAETTQTITVNDSGTFTVMLTDLNGCTNYDTTVVSIGTGLTVVLNDETLCEGDTIVFNAGNPGTTYTWSTGENTQTIFATDAGVYSVTVVDANNCSGSDSATVTVVQLPPLSAGADTAICEGESITLTALGAGTFEWSTTDTSASITVAPLQDETYTVTLTGGNGCTVSDDVFVSVNAYPSFDLGADFSLCNGDGATLSASDATQYAWSTGESTADINVNPATTTTYSVTATNAGNCATIDSITITVDTPPAADAGVGDTICEGESATLTATGGGTYLWNNGNANSTITVTPATTETYTITVTAANGCTATDSVVVSVNPLPGVDLGDDIDYCPSELYEINASGGGTYLWNTGDTTEFIEVSPTTDETYCVTVTTDAGCVQSDCVDLFIRAVPVADAGDDVTICEGEETELTASGGTEYHWSDGSNDNPNPVSPTSTTTYTVTVSNGFGCEDVDDVTVTVNDAPDVTLFGFDTTFYCIYQAPIVVAGNPPGGILTGTGINNDGEWVAADAGVGTHVISYSVTSSNGCVGTDSETITVDECVGTVAIPNELLIKIYPNPADAFVFIEVEGLKEAAGDLQMYDAIGKLVLTSRVVNGINQLDIASFATGSYLLQIRYGSGIYTRQLIRNY